MSGVNRPAICTASRCFDTNCCPYTYVQVRAGQGQCEADNYVLTNTVFKTSMSNGLSREGKRQVARQVDVAAPDSKHSTNFDPT